MQVSDLEKSTLSASVFLGMLVGGLAAGLISDAYGRRNTLVACLTTNAVFGLLSAALPSWWWLATCRVIAGAFFQHIGHCNCHVSSEREVCVNENCCRRGRGRLGAGCVHVSGRIHAASTAWLLHLRCGMVLDGELKRYYDGSFDLMT